MLRGKLFFSLGCLMMPWMVVPAGAQAPQVLTPEQAAAAMPDDAEAIPADEMEETVETEKTEAAEEAAAVQIRDQ